MLVSVASLLGVALGACGGSGSQAAGAREVAMKITDAGCEPGTLELQSGPTTFKVVNEGTSKVTELEVLTGSRIEGEVENVTAGLSRKFSLDLKPGSYGLYCPGGSKSANGVLNVSGPSTTMAADTSGAVANYRTYVQKQADELVTRTTAFKAAIDAGDVAKAKDLYPSTRAPYERIEPVAESFGDLDPQIDGRADDTPVDQITGFHRLESALWEKGSTEGMQPIADKLLADVMTLKDNVSTFEIDASKIANGANDLLGEVSQSKVTGEEERYSHTDLWDFDANVAGAKAAIDAVRPLLDKKDPALGQTIDARFAQVQTDLQPYKRGDGWALYNTLTPEDTRRLSQGVDALAEPVSEVAGKVVSAQ